VTPLEVGKVHAALAHALLNVWSICPNVQQLLQAELGLWLNPVRRAMSTDQYLELVTGLIAMGGAEQAAIDALAEAKNEFRHIDEYLQMMFQIVSRLVSEKYQECTSTALRDVSLRVVGVTNPIYPDPVAFGELGTIACVPPLRAEYGVTVKVTLIPGLLGPPSWAVIPYLLCHELVCHVNQGAPMDSGDPFAEGWMDLVAKRLHDEWVNEIFPWAPAMARSAANRLSDVVVRRWQGLAEPSMTTRAARGQGRYAADFAAQQLEPSRDATDRGLSGLTCLSLQLNVVSSTVAARKDFVSGVNNARVDPALQARLLAALGRWRRGGPVNEVLFFS
jgi:hypothetical protein